MSNANIEDVAENASSNKTSDAELVAGNPVQVATHFCPSRELSRLNSQETRGADFD